VEFRRDLERQATEQIDSVLALAGEVRTMIEQDDSFRSYTDKEKEYYAHKLSPKEDVLFVVDEISTSGLLVKERLSNYSEHPLDKKTQMDLALIPLDRFTQELELLHGRTGIHPSPELSRKINAIRVAVDNVLVATRQIG